MFIFFSLHPLELLHDGLEGHITNRGGKGAKEDEVEDGGVVGAAGLVVSTHGCFD